MSNKESIKKWLNNIDQKIKALCDKIPQRIRIALIIILLSICGIVSIYQLISSLTQLGIKDNDVEQLNIIYNYGTE